MIKHNNMKMRALAGALAVSLALIPVNVNAKSYRGSGYCCKTFKTSGGQITASVSYAKNVSLTKDQMECIAYTSGNIYVGASCYYNEKNYKYKFLEGKDRLTAVETRKKISRSYTYGKLSLSGDVQNTLYADE